MVEMYCTVIMSCWFLNISLYISKSLSFVHLVWRVQAGVQAAEAERVLCASQGAGVVQAQVSSSPLSTATPARQQVRQAEMRGFPGK